MPKLYDRPFLTLNRDEEGRPALIFEDRVFRCDQMYESTPLSLSVADRLREFGACLLVAADSLLEADGYDTEHEITPMESDSFELDIGGVEGVELRVVDATSKEDAIRQAREALAIWTHGKITKPALKRPAEKIELVHWDHFELGLPEGNPFADHVSFMIYNQHSKQSAKAKAEEFLEYMLHSAVFDAAPEKPGLSSPGNHVVLAKPHPIVLDPGHVDLEAGFWDVSLSTPSGDDLPGVIVRVYGPEVEAKGIEGVIEGCNRLFDFIGTAHGLPLKQDREFWDRVRCAFPEDSLQPEDASGDAE